MKKGLIFIISVMAVLFTGCRREESPQDLEIALRKNWSYASVPISLGTDIDVSSSTKAISDDNWIEEIELQGSAETKSSVSIEAVEKFVKARLYAFYRSGSNWYCCEDIEHRTFIDVTSKTFNWSLPVNVPLRIYVVVNYGDLSLPEFVAGTELNESGVLGIMFSCDSPEELKSLEGANYGMPMAGIIETELETDASPINIKTKRLFAKYNIYFDTSSFEQNNYSVGATYIRTAQANTMVPFFVEGYKVPNDETGAAQVKTIDFGTTADVSELNKKSNSNQVTLYFLENCQGERTGAEKWYEVNNAVSGAKYLSYIDLGVAATDNSTGLTRYFNYYIYLGDDCTTNFDVRRNVFRSIKVKLPFDHETNGFRFTNINEISVSPGESIEVPYETTIALVKYVIPSTNSDELKAEVIKDSHTSNITGRTNYPYQGICKVTAKVTATEGTYILSGGNPSLHLEDNKNVQVSPTIVLDAGFVVADADNKYIFQKFTAEGKLNIDESSGISSAALNADNLEIISLDKKLTGTVNSVTNRNISANQKEYTINVSGPVPKSGNTTFVVKVKGSNIELGNVTVYGKTPRIKFTDYEDVSAAKESYTGLMCYNYDICGKNASYPSFVFVDTNGNTINGMEYFSFSNLVMGFDEDRARDYQDPPYSNMLDTTFGFDELLFFSEPYVFGNDNVNFSVKVLSTEFDVCGWTTDREFVERLSGRNVSPFPAYIPMRAYYQDLYGNYYRKYNEKGQFLLSFGDPFKYAPDAQTIGETLEDTIYGIRQVDDIPSLRILHSNNCFNDRTTGDLGYWPEKMMRELNFSPEGMYYDYGSLFEERFYVIEGCFPNISTNWSRVDSGCSLSINSPYTYGHCIYQWVLKHANEDELALDVLDIKINRVIPIFCSYEYTQDYTVGYLAYNNDYYGDLFAKAQFHPGDIFTNSAEATAIQECIPSVIHNDLTDNSPVHPTYDELLQKANEYAALYPGKKPFEPDVSGYGPVFHLGSWRDNWYDKYQNGPDVLPSGKKLYCYYDINNDSYSIRYHTFAKSTGENVMNGWSYDPAPMINDSVIAYWNEPQFKFQNFTQKTLNVGNGATISITKGTYNNKECLQLSVNGSSVMPYANEKYNKLVWYNDLSDEEKKLVCKRRPGDTWKWYYPSNMYNNNEGISNYSSDYSSLEQIYGGGNPWEPTVQH